MRRCAIVLLITICHTLNAMHLDVPMPREIVISDEHGLVERIPTGDQALQRDMAFWMIKELSSQNKELQEQLAAQKKKWYVITAGVATTVIPLVICGIELWNSTHECE